MVRYFRADFFLSATFLEMSFIMSMLADFLRRNNLVAKSIFYSIGSIVTLAAASSRVSRADIESSFYKTFELLIILLIFIYGTIVHPQNKFFRFFVWLIATLAILIRIEAFDQFGLLPVFIGLGIMMMGVHYMNKSKNLQNESLAAKSIQYISPPSVTDSSKPKNQFGRSLRRQFRK